MAKLTLKQALTKFGEVTTLADMMKKMGAEKPKSGLARATPEQIAEYDRAVAKRKAYEDNARAVWARKEKARIERQCQAALKLLRKYGRLPATTVDSTD